VLGQRSIFYYDFPKLELGLVVTGSILPAGKNPLGADTLIDDSKLPGRS
jgi:hypothetical protein